MKILVFGKGFLGNRIANAWPDAVLDAARIDDKQAVLRAIDAHRPDAVINAAGKTGDPNVDWCETHQQETYQSNVAGPLILSEACAERSIYLLHVGSGCIFYGPSPDPKGWREQDFANPESVYSKTKYAADLVLSRLPNVGIARIRMPIDSLPSRRNFIDKLASYTRVTDVENSVTIIEDLLIVLHQLIEKRATGIFHVTNPGTMRHRDLLNLYREYVDPQHRCVWIGEDELVSSGLALKKRSNCILQSTRLTELGIFMRPIHEALRDTMLKYAQHKRMNVPPEPHPAFPSQGEGLRRPVGDAGRVDTRMGVSILGPVPNHTPHMKGVILAGGRGTRLAPLTNVTNKHLLPVANKQMILYPLQTLLDAGIRDIMIVTGPEFSGQFMNLLGSGASFGARITYRIQDESGGIAHALALAEAFVGQDHCTVILGDNIFDENFLPHVSSFQGGAMTFYKAVHDPQRFGVVEVDGWGRVLSIEEKPTVPRSNLAQVGLYIYDAQVFDIIRTLQPSKRGELEIADVNNAYLTQGKLIAKPARGFWSDAGTFQSLQRSNEYFAQKEGLKSHI